MDDLTTGRSPAPGEPPPAVDAVNWLGAATAEARLRLYCLPHAGGGAVSYLAWARRLAPDIEVVAIRLPGRETRFREPPSRRLGQLVPALTRVLADGGGSRPFAVFGHSYGALLAFEACRDLARHGLAAPVRLLVSGRSAPQLAPRATPVHAASDERVYQRLRELGGTPPEVLADPEIMAGLLPVLRADLEAAETYECRPGPPLEVPISVFGGAQDPYVPRPDLDAWGAQSRLDCRIRVYPGRHFFLHDDPTPVLRDLRSDLATGHPAAR